MTLSVLHYIMFVMLHTSPSLKRRKSKTLYTVCQIRQDTNPYDAKFTYLKNILTEEKKVIDILKKKSV